MDNNSIRFAVIGDMHYALSSGNRRQAASERLAWLRTGNRLILRDVVEEIAAAMPHFIIQLGDLINGEEDNDANRKAFKEILGIFNSTEIKTFFVRGNHDEIEPFRDTMLPHLSQLLNKNLDAAYYSFDYNDSHFVVLDSTSGVGTGDSMMDEKQVQWLENDLRDSRKKRIFIFAHSPPFYISRILRLDVFRDQILSMAQRYIIDAFFCGDYHNQVVLLRKLNNNHKILVIENYTVGYPFQKSGAVPLDDINQLFVPPREIEYFWGYLGGSNSVSWYLVEIDERTVKVDWMLLGKGPQRSFKWDAPGEIEEFKKIQDRSSSAEIEEKFLPEIKEAYLRMSLCDSCGGRNSVCLNDEKIGYLPKGNYYETTELEIPQNKFSTIQMTNKINISNQEPEGFWIGNVSLEIILRNGKIYRTNIDLNIYALSTKWDVNDRYVSSKIRHISPRTNIPDIYLQFEKKE